MREQTASTISSNVPVELQTYQCVKYSIINKVILFAYSSKYFSFVKSEIH